MRVSRRRLLEYVPALGIGALATGCARQVAVVPTISPATRAPATPAPAAAAPTMPATVAATATESAPNLGAALTEGLPTDAAYLAVVHGAGAEAMTMRALAALGGIERFVKNGYDVIIKPNICNPNFDNRYASTTNPEVVAALVKLCLGAGAGRVRVMDTPFTGLAKEAYVTSGIQAAVEAAGGEMEIMVPHKYVNTPIPGGKDLTAMEFYQPILEADLVINVPIPKDHELARLTLAGKNLLGTVYGPSLAHQNMGQRVAEIDSVVRPQLTVMDAVRILMANGPTGGDLADVKETNLIIASHDMVAVDSYATSLFGLQPSDIRYIQVGASMGLGTMDLGSIKVEELDI
jgi:uncharacterized protein (DUF362 family)